MASPWFLQELGLDEDTDERAIKKAYARRLRAIDQSTDIAGFTALHQAYKAAIVWREAADKKASPQTGAQVSSPAAMQAEITASDQGPGEDVVVARPAPPPIIKVASPSSQPHPAVTVHAASQIHSHEVQETAETLATRALHELVERLKQGGDAAQALADSLARVRQGHLQAPILFERHLLGRLAASQISQRVALFTAAKKMFEWSDIGHLQALGSLAQWIAIVEQQSAQWTREWQHLPSANAIAILHEGCADPLPRVQLWPSLRRIIQRYPDFMRLQLDHGRVVELQRLFDALSDSEKEWAEAEAAQRFAAVLRPPAGHAAHRPKARSYSQLAVLLSLAISFAIALALFRAAGPSPADQQVDGYMLDQLNDPRFIASLERCQQINTLVPAKILFTRSQRERLSNRAAICAAMNLWPTDLTAQQNLLLTRQASWLNP